ncbi:hypothetical protein ANO11243_023570 [Dothideomycetidae sp. 11243]|nr:hypothetical protein ANO11243_023570 [fungal sp. No.11243]
MIERAFPVSLMVDTTSAGYMTAGVMRTFLRLTRLLQRSVSWTSPFGGSQPKRVCASALSEMFASQQIGVHGFSDRKRLHAPVMHRSTKRRSNEHGTCVRVIFLLSEQPSVRLRVYSPTERGMLRNESAIETKEWSLRKEAYVNDKGPVV